MLNFWLKAVLESTTQALTGALINWAVTLLLLPLIWLPSEEMTGWVAVKVTILYAVVSIIRGAAIRMAFNWYTWKRVNSFAHRPMKERLRDLVFSRRERCMRWMQAKRRSRPF